MFTFLFSALQAAEQTSAPAKSAGMGAIGIFAQLLPFILIAIIFYFFIIRPQSKQRQLLKQMIDNINIGDKVITKGGIIGTISQILENSFIINLYDGSKLEILKNAVISMINDNQ